MATEAQGRAWLFVHTPTRRDCTICSPDQEDSVSIHTPTRRDLGRLGAWAVPRPRVATLDGWVSIGGNCFNPHAHGATGICGGMIEIM